MDDILDNDELASSEDIKIFEKKYNEELCKGQVSSTSQFEYACFLVRSKYSADINKGIVLLEDLYTKKGETGKRDYVYYLAVGNARLKKYDAAMKYVNGLLKVEPSNRQVLDLEAAIKKRMEKDALKGAAIAGGIILGLGALAGLGIAMARK
ncbi:UNVERIFIED_CONTAM: hypothetical protein RMT77_007672 [Armadillidium vulgare]